MNKLNKSILHSEMVSVPEQRMQFCQSYADVWNICIFLFLSFKGVLLSLLARVCRYSNKNVTNFV